MNNIDKFNRLTAEILSKLYENFPRRIELEPDKDMDRENRLFFIDTIRWLSDNGYLTYQSFDNFGNFFDVVLTEKGLMVLNSKPDIVKGKGTLGEYLKYVLKEGSVNAINEVVSLIPKIVLGGKK